MVDNDRPACYLLAPTVVAASVQNETAPRSNLTFVTEVKVCLRE